MATPTKQPDGPTSPYQGPSVAGIVVNLRGESVTLTLDEARELHVALEKLFGVAWPTPVYRYPGYTWPTYTPECRSEPSSTCAAKDFS